MMKKVILIGLSIAAIAASGKAVSTSWEPVKKSASNKIVVKSCPHCSQTWTCEKTISKVGLQNLRNKIQKVYFPWHMKCIHPNGK